MDGQPLWPAYLWGAVVAFPLGVFVGWRAKDWRIFVTRLFDYSQTRGEGE